MARSNIITALDKIAEYSLWALIALLPFSKSAIEICIVVAAIAWSVKKILKNDFRFRKTPINGLLIAFLMVSCISIINADEKLFILRSLFSKSLKYIVLYFVIIETIDSEAKIRNIMRAALLSSLIVIIDTYVQYYITHIDLLRLYPTFKFVVNWTDFTIGWLGFPASPPHFLGFPTGPFPFPNDLSAWILIFLMPSLFLFMYQPLKIGLRTISGLFAASLLHLFYLANTRSAWLAFFLAFFLALFIQNKKRLIVFILLAILLLSPFLVKDKLQDIFGFTSMQDRFYMWRIGWKIFLEHPIIGNGFNTFFTKFKEYREDEEKNKRGSYAHNGYLQLAADTGVLGLSVFLLMLSRAFVSISIYIKEKADTFLRVFALGLAAGILAFLVHSFFDTNLQSLPLVTLFWFSLAILMSLPQINEG